MDTTDNTGLGLIKKTIERVQNRKSLFVSALKKLLNSNEKQLAEFLGKTAHVQILKNLAFVCEIKLQNVATFVVGEKFKNRTENKVGIPIWMNNDFISKIIKPLKNASLSFVANEKLKKFTLIKTMNNSEIQHEFKNPQPIDVEVFLPLIWGIISLQENGEEKVSKILLLLNYRYANIFHIRLKDGSIVAVRVYWDDDKWVFMVDDIDSLDRMVPGITFFTFAADL